jgi:hypothetical protein
VNPVPSIPEQVGRAVLDFGNEVFRQFLPSPNTRALPSGQEATMGDQTLFDRVMGYGTTPQAQIATESTAGSPPVEPAPVIPTPDSVLSFLPEFSGVSLRPFGTNPFKALSSFDRDAYTIGTVAEPEISAELRGGDVTTGAGGSAGSGPLSSVKAGLPVWVWLLLAVAVIFTLRRK